MARHYDWVAIAGYATVALSVLAIIALFVL
jgi:hypothetical protein